MRVGVVSEARALITVEELSTFTPFKRRFLSSEWQQFVKFVVVIYPRQKKSAIATVSCSKTQIEVWDGPFHQILCKKKRCFFSCLERRGEKADISSVGLRKHLKLSTATHARFCSEKIVLSPNLLSVQKLSKNS